MKEEKQATRESEWEEERREHNIFKLDAFYVQSYDLHTVYMQSKKYLLNTLVCGAINFSISPEMECDKEIEKE